MGHGKRFRTDSDILAAETLLLLSSVEKSNEGRTEAVDDLLSLSYRGLEYHDVGNKSDGDNVLFDTLLQESGGKEWKPLIDETEIKESSNCATQVSTFQFILCCYLIVI